MTDKVLKLLYRRHDGGWMPNGLRRQTWQRGLGCGCGCWRLDDVARQCCVYSGPQRAWGWGKVMRSVAAVAAVSSLYV